MAVSIELRSDANEGQLNLLIEMLHEIREVSGDILEIGSWKCGTSGFIANCCPNRTVYAFDLFGGLPYGEGVGCEWFGDTDWEEIRATAAHFPNLRLVRGMHEETIPKFAESAGPIALIWMDSDHYPSHKVALKHLCQLLVPGGLIIFHDFRFMEVQQAISEELNVDDWKILDGVETHDMGILRKN